MRKIVNINDNWIFTKEDLLSPTAEFKNYEAVSIPHTWNNLDGQDGGSDYFRGACWYKKELGTIDTNNGRVFVEFMGSNSVTTVYLNGVEIAYHEGGYSTFRADLTEHINSNKNTLVVKVDNSEYTHVYPTMADFTFYGGIYRDVNLIYVHNTHIDLSYYGGNGVVVKSSVADDEALVSVDTYVNNATNHTVKVEIYEESNLVASTIHDTSIQQANLTIKNPHLWNGTIDPFLYRAVISLLDEDQIIDTVSVNFGIRTFYVDPNQGFFLNGQPYHLHGVSRHQDREDKGWAISKADHEEDMKLISEVGANTIRLAHYQHDQYFYDLADLYGQIVWAEIPFISAFYEEGKENTFSQMKELVIQNINHPSICFFGISNEISISGESDELFENLKELNALVKELDPSRLTTIANVGMVEMDNEMNYITDVLAYNHYMGWYGGEVSENGPWFDEFHKMNPTRPLGVSEYGAEGILKYHTEHPEVRDYSEEYHAYYHEQMLKTFATRPYIWATYVWNMFDFGSDMRDEGGVKGRNNKGLVTMDRKIKKDAFYAYKAYWSDESFVHIAGRRFVNRVISEPTTIKVYSNCEHVVLSINSLEMDLEGDKVFEIKSNMLIQGENIIKAEGYNGDQLVAEETIVLNGVLQQDESYILVEENDGPLLNGGGVANWFDDGRAIPTTLEIRDGFYSVEDKLGKVLENPEAYSLLQDTMNAMFGGKNGGMKLNKGMLNMLKNMTFKDIAKVAGKRVPKEFLYIVNDKLNKIEKTTNK